MIEEQINRLEMNMEVIRKIIENEFGKDINELLAKANSKEDKKDGRRIKAKTTDE